MGGAGALTGSSSAGSTFTEKDFYLAEFRGRTLGFALPAAETSELALLETVLRDLERGGARALVLSPDRALLEKLGAPDPVATSDPRWTGAVWRTLRTAARCALAVPSAEEFASVCRGVVVKLGLPKLAWVDETGGLRRPDGARVSFLDLRELEAWIAGTSPRPGEAGRLPLLREIRGMLREGVPAVNLCALAGLAEELFSYTGSGTLFTRERYVEVRCLLLDEYDAAHDLIRTGVAEGYLVERSPEQLEEVLEHGFGAFVEGRHLAGIGSLLPHAAAGAREIASLYTLTRFLGEGVGGHLVRFAVEEARRSGAAYLFACTASERVARFFEREGFRRVPPEAIPPEKWRNYDPSRRDLVRCLRHDLAGPSGPATPA